MKKQNKFLEFLSSKGFYTALFTCLFAVLAIAAFVSIRNIDAISKLTTYGEKDQLAVDDYLQPAVIQQDATISELTTNRRNEQENKTSPESDKNSGTVRRVETEEQQESNSEIKTEKDSAPQTQVKQTPSTTEETAVRDNGPDASAGEDEQAKGNTQKADSKDDAKPEASVEAKTETEKNPERDAEKATTSSAATFSDGDEMDWPLDGAIVMDYSVTHAIYDKTLDQYRTNPTISISSEVGAQVKAAAGGVVKSINIDPRTGYTVVLDHGGGWQSVYGQMQETILVKEGQSVERGQAIGGVGTPTKYGVLLGPHLVFGINKDDEPQNPKVVLAE